MSDRPLRGLRLLSAALSAAERGWPVFPLRPYGKHPAVRDWPHAASRDANQLAEWWARAPYNVGIVCGPAGLLVVDVDTDDPPPALVDLPVTYRVATPRGTHHYFAVPPVPTNAAVSGEAYWDRVRFSGRSTAGMLAPLVDTRAAGGYVVGAGSVLRIDSARYWYRAGSAPVASAPPWLLDALLPPRPVARAVQPARPGAYAAAVLTAERAGVEAAAVGTRNVRLFTAAFRLGQLAAGGLLTEQHVVTVLAATSARHVGVDGFTVAEAARAIDNGLRYGRRRPRLVA